jgi:hypothetical protein
VGIIPSIEISQVFPFIEALPLLIAYKIGPTPYKMVYKNAKTIYKMP